MISARITRATAGYCLERSKQEGFLGTLNVNLDDSRLLQCKVVKSGNGAIAAGRNCGPVICCDVQVEGKRSAVV